MRKGLLTEHQTYQVTTDDLMGKKVYEKKNIY